MIRVAYSAHPAEEWRHPLPGRGNCQALARNRTFWLLQSFEISARQLPRSIGTIVFHSGNDESPISASPKQANIQIIRGSRDGRAWCSKSVLEVVGSAIDATSWGRIECRHPGVSATPRSRQLCLVKDRHLSLRARSRSRPGVRPWRWQAREDRFKLVSVGSRLEVRESLQMAWRTSRHRALSASPGAVG